MQEQIENRFTNKTAGSMAPITSEEVEINPDEDVAERKQIMENFDTLTGDCNILKYGLDIEDQIENFCVHKTTGSLSHITTKEIEIKAEGNGAESGNLVRDYSEERSQYNNFLEDTNNHDTFDHKSQQEHNLEFYTAKSENRFKKMCKPRKSDLKTKPRQSQANGSNSEVQVYQCNTCGFNFKQKCDLKYHQFMQKPCSEAHIYKCEECEFKTKYKCSLKSHQSIHRNATEPQKYSCTKCHYETKYKRNLTRHVRVHKEDSEVQTYKCDTCSYETQDAGELRSHLVTHKTLEVQLYECDECSYKTDQKGNLNIHRLLHGQVSRWEMYQCTQCDFKTKCKSYLTSHLLMHTVPLEDAL